MNKKFVAGVVGVGLLAGGFGLSGIAFADNQNEDKMAPTESEHGFKYGGERKGGKFRSGEAGEHMRGEGKGGPRRGMKLESVAEALDVPVDEVRQGLREGRSIAELAEQNGVPVDGVIDALTAEAKNRITEMVNRTPEGHQGPKGK